VAAGLAVTVVALAFSAPRLTERTGTHAQVSGTPAPTGRRALPPAEVVSAPVRIADAATVRLLRRGDRVDVIAAADSPTVGEGPAAKVVAAGARVVDVPGPGEFSPEAGALVVLSVPRSVATQLAGAGATSRLAVTLC
jgi:hypothetical protein